MQHIISNLTYPPKDYAAHREGVVYVQFVVTAQGTTKDFTVIQNTGSEDMFKEVVRVLKKARFTPGQMDGEAVDSYMQVPVRFKLD